MKKAAAVLFALLLVTGCSSFWDGNANIQASFERADVDGTFVVYEPRSEKFVGYNRKRAQQRFVPASTFKIPNSLIGLSVGAIRDVDEVLPYGGEAQPFEVWENDMPLRRAITLSAVPIYQELARRIGIERMQRGVSALDYGNQDIGSSVDTFWLEGPLAISAIEQVIFLAGLAQGDLPIQSDVQASVREIVLLEETERYRLFGKTGWENAPGPGVGWWVGWVEAQGQIHSFALNIDIEQAEDAGKRIELGKLALQELGLLP